MKEEQGVRTSTLLITWAVSILSHLINHSQGKCGTKSETCACTEYARKGTLCVEPTKLCTPHCLWIRSVPQRAKTSHHDSLLRTQQQMQCKCHSRSGFPLLYLCRGRSALAGPVMEKQLGFCHLWRTTYCREPTEDKNHNQGPMTETNKVRLVGVSAVVLLVTGSAVIWRLDIAIRCLG